MKLSFAIALTPASSLVNHTGTWRTQRPVYLDRQAPCHEACPAGEDPRDWIGLARAGDLRGAWDAIVRVNPLPAVTGRVCYHPCESSCHRGQVDDAIGIHALERHVADAALREHWPLPAPAAASGRKVLVVGSGPAGLSAAYRLAQLGHEVTVREAAPALGGMLRYGIPRYRLPREVLDAEIARIAALGVRFETSARVDDVERTRQEGGFDACFAGIGAQLSHRIELPAADASRLVDALTLLGESPPELGRRVLVYGGGNTALDAARVAKRLGAEDTCIVYRRDRAHMPAHAFEVREAVEEGIRFQWLSTIERVEPGHAVIERMVLGPDGRPRPTGELETLDADAIVLAVGQDVDAAVMRSASDKPGVFLGGDMIARDRTVSVAIGQGRKGAQAIDEWLRRATHPAEAAVPVVPWGALNPVYVSREAAANETMLPPETRTATFAEVRGGLTDEEAQREADRCMSCGRCFECDNCFALCPDAAIAKLGRGRGFEIDYDFCKGCGICAHECPCGAIAMIPEPG